MYDMHVTGAVNVTLDPNLQIMLYNTTYKKSEKRTSCPDLRIQVLIHKILY